MLGIYLIYSNYMHLISWKMEKVHKLLCIAHIDNLCMEFIDDFAINLVILGGSWLVLY